MDAGIFSYLKLNMVLWSSTTFGPNMAFIGVLYYQNKSFINGSYVDNKRGYSIRLIKDATTLTHGQKGTYVGNDGRVYNTICIGTQEWLSENLAETKYRDGSAIPEVTDNTAWAALSTGALCAYNNDWNNAI
jgi:hypothetical protein